MKIKYILIIVLSLIIITCGPQDDIYVQVSSGLTPTISWDYGKVTQLTIMDITVDSLKVTIWDIHGKNWENNIRSPIVYGVNPDTLNIIADIAINDSTTKLIPGRRYNAGVMCGPAVGYCEFIATK